MSETLKLPSDTMTILAETSRTFFIPISRLSPILKEAVASAYLCMRAIDEIEDHPELPSETKISLLRSVSQLLLKDKTSHEWGPLFEQYKTLLPEVTLRLSDWVTLSPAAAVSTICKSTAAMASGMADWVSKGWQIQNEADLDSYTYCVAGAVGEMLSDIWLWFDGLETDRELAVSFGRGLQAVNIIRNREEDLARGVDYFPDGWEMKDMFRYAQRNLTEADLYMKSIHPGPILDFCRIPVALAQGTLDVLASGEMKLSRSEVKEIVRQLTGE